MPDEQEIAPEVNDGAWKKWRSSPSPQTMAVALNSVRPVINKVLDQVPGKSRDLMGSEAKRLAISAIKSYDPQHGASLSTHVYSHLQPVARGSSKFIDAIHRTRTDRNLVSQYLDGVNTLSQQLNREPNDDELVSHLKINPKQLEKMRRVAVGEISEHDFTPDDNSQGQDDNLSLWSEHVYSRVDPKSKLIFEYKTGRNGRPMLSSSEIAAKMGLSEVYVNKRANDMANQILQGVNSMKPLTGENSI
jgi:DNA-directed RNA polymerase specialized sigma subunit